jgi:hypothetical protein
MTTFLWIAGGVVVVILAAIVFLPWIVSGGR